MESIRDIFDRAGIEADTHENVCKGYYHFGDEKVFVEATITIDSYKLYLYHYEYSFELKRPSKDSIESALYLCLYLVPSVLFGCSNFESKTKQAATVTDEREKLPYNYYQHMQFQPPLQPMMREYPCLPNIGAGDLHGQPGARDYGTGNQMGRNHPFFHYYGKIRGDDIQPDTTKPDGFKTDLDKKFMFL